MFNWIAAAAEPALRPTETQPNTASALLKA
jgi:hypothetical protein